MKNQNKETNKEIPKTCPHGWGETFKYHCDQCKNKGEITTEDRLKAIEILVGGDYGQDADWYSCFEKKTKALSREKLEEFVIEFGKIITNVYVISHGGNSKCCEGKGAELVSNLLNIKI